jgi:hypothetical protein
MFSRRHAGPAGTPRSRVDGSTTPAPPTRGDRRSLPWDRTYAAPVGGKITIITENGRTILSNPDGDRLDIQDSSLLEDLKTTDLDATDEVLDYSENIDEADDPKVWTLLTLIAESSYTVADLTAAPIIFDVPETAIAFLNWMPESIDIDLLVALVYLNIAKMDPNGVAAEILQSVLLEDAIPETIRMYETDPTGKMVQVFSAIPWPQMHFHWTERLTAANVFVDTLVLQSPDITHPTTGESVVVNTLREFDADNYPSDAPPLLLWAMHTITTMEFPRNSFDQIDWKTPDDVEKSIADKLTATYAGDTITTKLWSEFVKAVIYLLPDLKLRPAQGERLVPSVYKWITADPYLYGEMITADHGFTEREGATVRELYKQEALYGSVVVVNGVSAQTYAEEVETVSKVYKHRVWTKLSDVFTLRTANADVLGYTADMAARLEWAILAEIDRIRDHDNLTWDSLWPSLRFYIRGLSDTTIEARHDLKSELERRLPGTGQIYNTNLPIGVQFSEVELAYVLGNIGDYMASDNPDATDLLRRARFAWRVLKYQKRRPRDRYGPAIESLSADPYIRAIAASARYIGLEGVQYAFLYALGSPLIPPAISNGHQKNLEHFNFLQRFAVTFPMYTDHVPIRTWLTEWLYAPQITSMYPYRLDSNMLIGWNRWE